MKRTGIIITNIEKVLKAKCKVCRVNAVARPGAIVCGIECAVTWQSKVMEKAARVEIKRQAIADRAKLETLKSIPELKAEAQTIFNEFIRERDKDFSCICCDKWNKSEALTGGTWDAGHYRSRGSADHLRFNENNVHKQLKNCNRYASGNVVEYRLGLIKRIGLPFVEELESDQKIVKWTREQLMEIKLTYRKKLKELKNA